MKNLSKDYEILLYRSKDGDVKVDVLAQNDTLWLTQKRMAALFRVQVPAIAKHLKNIFETRELEESSVTSILETTAADGKTCKTRYHSLDAIIAVGYRVNSMQATQFRIWATQTLKEFFIKKRATTGKCLRVGKRNTKRLRNTCQAFIACPQTRVGRELRGGQQVQIHKTNTFTHKVVGLKKEQCFLMTGFNGAREILPKSDQLLPVLQITTGQLACNHRVDTHLTLRKPLRERLIPVAKMIHPNRGVHQNHCFGTDRCRGTGLNFGSEPPKVARRRALSRSINAFRPSRNRADFSFMPVNCTAWAYKSSSIFNVVRIVGLRYANYLHQIMHHYMPTLMPMPVAHCNMKALFPPSWGCKP